MRSLSMLFVIGLVSTLLVGCRQQASEDNQKRTSPEDAKAPTKEKTAYEARLAILMEAAEKGRVSQVYKAIKEGADVNDKDDQGDTALMKAAAKGNESIVVALLAAGARPNEKNEHGETALMKAAENGQAAILKFLLDPDSVGKAADELLKKAGVEIKLGASGLARGETLVNAQDDKGQTALIRAARKNQSEAVSILLRPSANPLLKTKDGATALFIAVNEGHLDTVKVLAGPNFWSNAYQARLLGDSKGMTPLLVAIQKGDKELVVEMLNVPWFENNTNETPEIRAKKLAEYVNQTKDRSGKTALDYAKEGGHKDIIELLAKAGAVGEEKKVEKK